MICSKLQRGSMAGSTSSNLKLLLGTQPDHLTGQPEVALVAPFALPPELLATASSAPPVAHRLQEWRDAGERMLVEISRLDGVVPERVECLRHLPSAVRRHVHVQDRIDAAQARHHLGERDSVRLELGLAILDVCHERVDVLEGRLAEADDALALLVRVGGIVLIGRPTHRPLGEELPLGNDPDRVSLGRSAARRPANRRRGSDGQRRSRGRCAGSGLRGWAAACHES